MVEPESGAVVLNGLLELAAVFQKVSIVVVNFGVVRQRLNAGAERGKKSHGEWTRASDCPQFHPGGSLPRPLLPEQRLPRQPDLVLMDRLPGGKQEQQNHRKAEDGGAISAHHCAQATHTERHQDAVPHAVRRGRGQKPSREFGKHG